MSPESFEMFKVSKWAFIQKQYVGRELKSYWKSVVTVRGRTIEKVGGWERELGVGAVFPFR